MARPLGRVLAFFHQIFPQLFEELPPENNYVSIY